MKIGERFKIESDELNVTLYELKNRISRNKKPYKDWDEVGHFSKMSEALKFMVELRIRETHLRDFATVVEEINAIKKDIDALSL